MSNSDNVLQSEPFQGVLGRMKARALGITDTVWRFLTSVKLTVVLLLAIALTSILGTVIPQNESPDEYLRVFGDFVYRYFDLLDIFDMYHSFWFQSFILLLALNIVVCSIDRLSATWKTVFARSPRFNLSAFRKASQKETFDSKRSPDSLQEEYSHFISGRIGRATLEETKKGFCVFAEKWRWTRLGVYIVHLSVVLLLVGSLVGSMFGFEGYVNIPEGETIGQIRLRSPGEVQPLGFAVRCDDFNISYYDNGSPKEYRSSLTIIDGGTPVVKKDIIVNDPLRYKGIRIFQSSYGKIPAGPGSRTVQARHPDEATSLRFVDNESGSEFVAEARIGDPIALSGDLGTFVLEDYRESTTFGGQEVGEAYLGTLTPKTGDPMKILLPLAFPNFDKMRRGAVAISVEPGEAEAGSPQRKWEPSYYTGLQVIKDPGVWVVYSGFIAMIIGLFVTFFMSHQRFCVEVVKKGKKSRVIIAGRSNRNGLGIQNKIRGIAHGLAAVE